MKIINFNIFDNFVVIYTKNKRKNVEMLNENLYFSRYEFLKVKIWRNFAQIEWKLSENLLCEKVVIYMKNEGGNVGIFSHKFIFFEIWFFEVENLAKCCPNWVEIYQVKKV